MTYIRLHGAVKVYFGVMVMILTDNIFSFLGDNFIFVIVFAVELLVAVFLLSSYLRNRAFGKKSASFSGLPECSSAEPLTAVLMLKSKEKEPVYITANFETVTGISSEKLKSDIEILNQLSDECRIFDELKTWDGKQSMAVTFSLLNTDKTVRLSACKSKDKNYDIFVFSDVTSFKNECLRLEEKIRIAQEESVTKTRFLSHMSHEIRTPMNGVIGMLSLAKKQATDNVQELDYLEKAEDLSKYLLSVINDILDLSRIEAGKLELEAKPLDLRDIADKLDDMFRETIEAKKVRFNIEFQNFDNYCLIGDSMRISQVLINLLSNASKFTSKGEISVTFRQMLKENGKIDFMVLVHDTGIGMKAEFLEKIFRPFEQESVDVTKKYGGSGLGMPITDNLVRIMGGNIVINSMPGKGSDFSVFLSLPEAAPEQAAKLGLERKNGKLMAVAEEYSYDGKKILLAEDNEINAEIAVDILTDYGAHVDVAANGRICVEMFKKSDTDYYDLVLMDVQMPELDGREAARQIRALKREDAKRVCIFALSADAFVEDKRLSMEAGMDGHFTKPVDFIAIKKELGAVRRKTV